MVVNSIKVFARVKKEHELKEKLYDIVRKTSNYEDIIFHKGIIADIYTKFRFNEIFDQDTEQDIIFETVAKPVVSSVLQGFNGTVFAYGQTGSGKTYTMTGSTKKYQDRGIIPRSLQFIFSVIEKTEEKPTLYISYMEIYNEICYDLLNPKDNKTASRLEELSRVVVLEDKKGEARLRNLSVLPVSTEEEAMRLLFLGDTNRAIAETPLNEYSSRSHCILTIYITSRQNDTQSLRYSKLNLVDLAGSERVYKSNITGSILNEAKHINLSLHFLQQVILALSESKRVHIPYRNSLMTFILKDSLGGNCLTVMLATVAVSRQSILETISTCKFAQRVSLIKIEPIINEVSDPYQEILLLKNEIQELRKQLANRNSSVLELESQVLTNLQKEECEHELEKFLNTPDKTLKIEMDAKILQYCFSIFKNKIQKLEEQQQVVKHKKIQPSKACFLKNCQNNQDSTKDELDKDNFSPKSQHDENLLQEFMSKPQNCEEINYYTKILSYTYEKAKVLALTIEECQTNIRYIREKLEVTSNAGCSKQKMLLSRELKYQQNIYRNSLGELKELKQESMQLEAGLKKAKARMKLKFNEWLTGTDYSDMTTNTQKNSKIHFQDDLNMIKDNCGDHRSKKRWMLGLDSESNHYQLCQCNYSTYDQSDSLTIEKHSQDQNYFHHDLRHSRDIQRYYFKEGLTTVPNNYCVLDIQQPQQPQRKKSGITFLPEINSMDRKLYNSISKSMCEKLCLPQIKNNLNRESCGINNSNNLISQCNEEAYYKQSYEDCDCKDGRCYEELNYTNDMLISSKYLCNQNAQIYPNPVAQSEIEYCNQECIPDCDCFKTKRFQHSQGHKNYLNAPHTVSSMPKNLGENDTLSIKDGEGYMNPILNNIYFALKDDGTKGDLSHAISLESLAYVDTQLVPIKLAKENPTEAFNGKNRFKNTKIEKSISTNCQEISSSMEESITKTTSKQCLSSNCQKIINNLKESSAKSRTKETKTIMHISPICQEVPCTLLGSTAKTTPKCIPPNGQEIHSSSLHLYKDNLHDHNKNNDTERKEIKEITKTYGVNIEAQKSSNEKKYNIFLESDTDDFRKYMKAISLTGDEEIDREICNFYRSKVCS